MTKNELAKRLKVASYHVDDYAWDVSSDAVLQLVNEIEQSHKHSVSGKRPIDIYSGALNEERISKYRKLAHDYNVQESTVRDIFCAGADWALSQAACASGAVDTVAEEEDREIIVNAKPTAEYKIHISKIEKITREAPSGEQP